MHPHIEAYMVTQHQCIPQLWQSSSICFCTEVLDEGLLHLRVLVSDGAPDAARDAGV